MKVRCIDNTNFRGTCYLTINKIYDTIRDYSTYWEVVNDINEESSYFKSRFIDVKKDRREKLNKINENANR
jgi:hypothetical protein